MTHRNTIARKVISGISIVHTARRHAGQHLFSKLVIEVSYVRKNAFFNHTVNKLVAKAVDIHSLTATPVNQTLNCLSGAINRDAAEGHLSLFLNNWATTAWAGSWHLELNSICRSKTQNWSYNLWNDISCLVDNDGIALAHVFTTNLVKVVEGCTRNGRTCNSNGIKLSNRCEYARTTYLNTNFSQNGLLFLWWELKCNSPTRSARSKS